MNYSRILAILLLANTAVLAQPSSPSLTDADEIRIGGLLADQFAKSEGIRSTPQTTKIDQYLQKVGDQLAQHAHRKLPYKFHFDPDPTFKSAFALPGGQIFVGAGILAMMDTSASR